MCCFRIRRCGWNRYNRGCGDNSGCGCGNDSGCGCGRGCGCGCRGGNSGYGYGCGCDCGCNGGNSGGGYDICADARRQAYREGFHNDCWEGFNDATWGNPGCNGCPILRTAGGPGPAIVESGCGCDS